MGHPWGKAYDPTTALTGPGMRYRRRVNPSRRAVKRHAITSTNSGQVSLSKDTATQARLTSLRLPVSEPPPPTFRPAAASSKPNIRHGLQPAPLH